MRTFRHLLFLGYVIIAVLRAEPSGIIPGEIPADAGNLSHVARKISAGQAVRVGFIGGSITQGSGAKNHGDSYYWQTKLKLAAFAKERGAALDTLLAAVGGTGSDYGVYRVGVQLLDKDIDLLVVEFAVNDFKNPAALDGMEGIVRQALKRNPRMGVVLFHTASRAMIEDFYARGEWPPSVAAFHRVAQHYRLAEVHAGPKVLALFQGGQSAPEAFFPDKTHPSKEGHAFYAGLLSDALIAALSRDVAPAGPPATLPAPLGSGRLERARLAPLTPLVRGGNWSEIPPGYYTYSGSWKSVEAGASLGFDVKDCESLALVCVKATRLRVSGPGFEKILSVRGRPGGIPSLQTIHAGPGPLSGRITVAVEPDAQGNAEAELAGLAVITAP